MTEHTRNLAAGATVIVALALLGGMILLFTGLPEVFQGGYEIKIAADTTHDAHAGDGVHLSGMRIGRVTEIRFTDPARPYEGVTLFARIDREVALPGNVRAFFFTRGMIGAAYIELKTDGPERIDPATGKPLKCFPTDGSIVMDSRHVGSGLIPDELTLAMKSLMKLADNLNLLIAPPPAPAEAPPADQAAPAPPAEVGLRGTIAKLNAALDAMSAVLGDAENQQNLKTSLANLAKATAAATEAMTSMKEFAQEARRTASEARTAAEGFSKLAENSRRRIDELADKLIEDAEKISKLMTTINRVATKVDSGKGTVGMLLNDPQLYNSFLEATRQMDRLMGEFRQLVDVWKKRGVELKL